MYEVSGFCFFSVGPKRQILTFNFLSFIQDGYWALGTTPEGCKPCKCDPGGAKSYTCDDVSGMCQCKQYLTGRQCNEVRPGFYVPNLDNNIFEAEDTKRSEGVSLKIQKKKSAVLLTTSVFFKTDYQSISSDQSPWSLLSLIITKIKLSSYNVISKNVDFQI